MVSIPDYSHPRSLEEVRDADEAIVIHRTDNSLVVSLLKGDVWSSQFARACFSSHQHSGVGISEEIWVLSLVTHVPVEDGVIDGVVIVVVHFSEGERVVSHDLDYAGKCEAGQEKPLAKFA